MTDTIAANEMHKGSDGIVRAPFATAYVRGLWEANHLWLCVMAASAAFFVWQATMGDVPPFGRRLLIGVGLGGVAGFVLSGLRIWHRGRRTRADNAALGERLIQQVAAHGIPSGSQARGCVVINDTWPGAVDGLIVDPPSKRMALIASGEVIYGATGDLRTGPTNRSTWSRVHHQNHPEAVAVLPLGVVRDVGLSA